MPEVPGFWESGDHRLEVTQSQVHAAAGNERKVIEAARRILSGARPSDGYQIPVYAHPDLAHCAVVNGGIDEGARQAAQALDSLPVPYRNAMVTARARRVLRAVPWNAEKAERSRSFAVWSSRAASWPERAARLRPEILSMSVPDVPPDGTGAMMGRWR
ncbi:hypothetical protein ABGB17_05675 [Sphaerisporangium sp. B11E5]|uniref:hypothetical protein n=1 Tax=Sphaerisporangium sp. B11E5 TaxID=3153563 RepID=UPI00325D9DAF